MANPYTLNQYPWWKYLLIGLIMLWGLIFALPNLFGEDPAVQISGARANIAIDSAFQTRITGLLDAEQLPHKRVELEEGRVLIRSPTLKGNSRLRTFSGTGWAVITSSLSISPPPHLGSCGLSV